MQFKIHRGTKEIGGSCIEVWTDKTRIVLDFGMPLVFPDNPAYDLQKLYDYSIDQLIGFGLLPEIQGLYLSKERPVNGLFISHAHMDHYGLIDFIRPDLEVFLGAPTHELIKITSLFSGKTRDLKRCNYFKSAEPLSIGDIIVTPYLMDHSAFDAYAFLIESEGKSIFYSGDFRKHGRKPNAFYWFTHNCLKNVDFLLLEGTSIGRSEKVSLSEPEIESIFSREFSKHKFTMVYSSGQNIDRLVSIYKACKNAGRIFAIDFYTANVLLSLSKYASLPFPSPNFPEIRVFFPWGLSKKMSDLGHKQLLYNFTDFKISKEQINGDPGKIVMFVRPTMKVDINRLFCLSGGTFIYSLWSGYLKDKRTNDFVSYLQSKGMEFMAIHTSGHADIPTLREMISALNPSVIIPVHTFESNRYQEVFPDRNIRIVNDKDVIDVV